VLQRKQQKGEYHVLRLEKENFEAGQQSVIEVRFQTLEQERNCSTLTENRCDRSLVRDRDVVILDGRELIVDTGLDSPFSADFSISTEFTEHAIAITFQPRELRFPIWSIPSMLSLSTWEYSLKGAK